MYNICSFLSLRYTVAPDMNVNMPSKSINQSVIYIRYQIFGLITAYKYMISWRIDLM